MKQYCLDTCGLSTPFEAMPEDIYDSIWLAVCERIVSGIFAVNTEIYSELLHIKGDLGKCLRGSKGPLLLEVGQSGWDWETYIEHNSRMNKVHEAYIQEMCGLSGTVGRVDVSIIAMAKTLDLPVISSETAIKSPIRKKIPNICTEESVEHLTFNDFLRKEKITSSGK